MVAEGSRNTRRIQKIRAEYKANRPQPCMRCGMRIDYEAPKEDPNSFNLGHIKAWATHPELREDPGNMQQEHASCGKSAGIRDGRDNRLGMQSEDW